jgi:hypothetical protein
MFTLTPAQAMLLTTGWLAVISVLLLGVFKFLPRSRRRVPAYVTCPMLGARIGAQLVRDEWTRGFREVLSCEALGGYAPVTCNRKCVRAAARPIVPLIAP